MMLFHLDQSQPYIHHTIHREPFALRASLHNRYLYRHYIRLYRPGIIEFHSEAHLRLIVQLNNHL